MYVVTNRFADRHTQHRSVLFAFLLCVVKCRKETQSRIHCCLIVLANQHVFVIYERCQSVVLVTKYFLR